MATEGTGSKKSETTTGNDPFKGGVDTAGLKKEAGTTIDNAKEAGSNLLADAKTAIADKANTAVDEKKAVLTGGLTSVADSIRKFSGTLGEAEANPLTEYSAKYAETAATKVEDVARYFETADFKTVSRDVESFARRNPAVFVGGAFALGIIAARFMKSSGGRGDSRNAGQGAGGRRASSKGSTGKADIQSAI